MARSALRQRAVCRYQVHRAGRRDHPARIASRTFCRPHSGIAGRLRRTGLEGLLQEPDEASASRDFDPQEVERRGWNPDGAGDQRSGNLYVFTGKVALAIRVAMVTRRPLLVRGPPGWGKSSLAHVVANILGWRYLEKVISSRTQARDLCRNWTWCDG